MQRTLQFLLLASDASITGEFDGVWGQLPPNLRVAVHAERDIRRGVEHALNRAPDVVILDLGADVDGTHRLVEELGRGGAATKIFMAYSPSALPGEEGSSSVLIRMIRAGVSDFIRRPVAAPELEELIRRHFDGAERGAGRRGRVLSFVGNKGGVGKSTLSLSTAYALAESAPDRVLLVDASLQYGSMCDLLGVTPEATMSDAARQVDRLDERLLRSMCVPHPSGLRVLAAPANAIEAAPVDEESFARILAVAKRAFDFVVVDTFPLIDGVTIAVLDVSDFVFVVTNDFVPVILGTVELLKVLERIGVSEDRIRVVLNRTAGGYRGRLGNLDVARKLARDVDFVVPFSKATLAATNRGEPHVARAPRWRGFGRAIRAIEASVRGSSPGESGARPTPGNSAEREVRA